MKPPRIPRHARRLLRAARSKAGLTLLVVLVVSLVYVHQRWQRDADVLLHVSYDASRSYFEAIDRTWSGQHPDIRLRHLHAGSVQQSRAMVRGLKADVVSFASAAEIQSISNEIGCIQQDWAEYFPFGGSPYTSTIVFVVRPGNPKNIRDWADLARSDVRLAAPSPRVSGAGRYAWLAAGYFAPRAEGIEGFNAAALYQDAWLIEQGAHQALDVFMRERRADVFLTWENEALQMRQRFGDRAWEVVYPSHSLLAEPVVAIVTCHAVRRGTHQRALDYLNFLYSEKGQKIAEEQGLRARIPSGQVQWSDIELITVDAAFGSWAEAWRDHFAPNGSFERYLLIRRAQRGGSE